MVRVVYVLVMTGPDCYLLVACWLLVVGCLCGTVITEVGHRFVDLSGMLKSLLVG